MTVNDEQIWLEAARKGDRNAFSKLVQAYQAPVYNLCYRMIGNVQEAEEAAQETFLKAYTRLETYDPGQKFSNWMLSIASHHCIDRLRRRRFTWLSVEDEATLSWLRSEEDGPEEVALRSERAAAVRTMLKQLEPAYRAPVVLRYWHDLSYKEIAAALDLTEAAVKSRLHRARLQLAELIEAAPAEAAPTGAAGYGLAAAGAAHRSQPVQTAWSSPSVTMARG